MLGSAFLTVFGLGALCWLLFTLAVYALPFWVGLSAAFWLQAAGQGLLIAIFGGILAAGGVATLGEVVFARLRSIPLRLLLGLVYAIPAGLAGFHASTGLLALTGTGATSGLVLAALTALVVGATAFARLSGGLEADGSAGRADSGARAAPEG